MKIKKKRQVTLDELLPLVWSNKFDYLMFKSDNNNFIDFDTNGMIRQAYGIKPDDLFTITEEIEITEDTTINLAYRIKTERGWQTFDKNETTINKIINIYKRHPHAYLEFIYLLNPNGSIGELIWEDGEFVG